MAQVYPLNAPVVLLGLFLEKMLKPLCNALLNDAMIDGVTSVRMIQTSDVDECDNGSSSVMCTEAHGAEAGGLQH